MKTMVKLFGLLIIIPLLFSSCEDDDEGNGASIIGTWDETSFTASGCTDPGDNETSTCTSGCERIVVTETTITIDTDPPLTYTVSGNQITVTIPGFVPVVVTFEVTATTLTITQQDSAADGGCKNVTVYKRV